MTKKYELLQNDTKQTESGKTLYLIIEKHELWLATEGREGARANLEDTNLEGANLEGASLRGANLEVANLAWANLHRANLSGANIYGANLAWANLSGADLYGTNLSGANIYGANLSGANLNGSHIDEANLTRANLEGANLRDANLEDANLTWANLTRANLEHANLMETIGNMKHVKSVFCDTYPVTYTAEVMQIGCENHRIEDWLNFDDERIIGMGGKTALKWWRKWKPIIQQIISASPATSTATGYEDNWSE